MKEIENLAAEIVKAQAALFDIEHDIKLLTRRRKKVRRTMYISGEGANLGDPYVAKDVIGGQFKELSARKAECEKRLENLQKEKQKQEEQTNVR